MVYPSRASTRILTGVALAVASVLFAGCSASSGDAGNLSDGDTAPGLASPVFEHIHALTVDPDNGDLLVATH